MVVVNTHYAGIIIVHKLHEVIDKIGHDLVAHMGMHAV